MRTISLGLSEVEVDDASNAHFVRAPGLWATITCVPHSQSKWAQVISSIFVFLLFSTSIRLLCSPPSGHNLQAQLAFESIFQEQKLKMKLKKILLLIFSGILCESHQEFRLAQNKVMISKSMWPLLGFLFLSIKLTFYIKLMKDTGNIMWLPPREARPQLLCTVCPCYRSKGKCSARQPPRWTWGSLSSWSVYLSSNSSHVTWSMCSIKIHWRSEWIHNWRRDSVRVCKQLSEHSGCPQPMVKSHPSLPVWILGI